MGVFRRGNKYWIDYRDPNGKRIREPVGYDKRVAQRALDKVRTEIAEGKYLDKRQKAKETAFSDMAKRYLAWAKEHKRSWKRDETVIKVLSESFGNCTLQEISQLDVERFKLSRNRQRCKARPEQTISPYTVNRELKCLGRMFSLAMEWDLADSNPVARVRLLKEPPGRIRYLEKGEIPTLLDACVEPLRSIVLLAIHTGMRRGELLALKWEHVDLQRRQLLVETSKNGESRHVPLSHTAVETLSRLKEGARGPWVFPSRRRGGERLKSVDSSFRRAVQEAGIDDFRFHDLRHTAASQLVMAGVDLRTVQEILGHKTQRMTVRYAHLSAEHKMKAADALDKALSRRETQVGHNLVTLPRSEAEGESA